MTTEVVQRTEEKMRLLGPLTGRLSQELLQPLINRVYSILARRRPTGRHQISWLRPEPRYRICIATGQGAAPG